MKNNLIDSIGFLTEAGKEASKNFKYEIQNLLNHATTENDLRVLGGVLSKVIGDLVSDRISVLKNKQQNILYNLSDNEFNKYLQDKYGKDWQFVKLTEKEIERVSEQFVDLSFDKILNRDLIKDKPKLSGRK